MEVDYLRILILIFPVLAAVAAGVFALMHKRKAALRVVTPVPAPPATSRD